MAKGVENVIIPMYAKGMSNQEIEEQIRKQYDINVSTSTISRVTHAIAEDIVAWRNRPPDKAVYIAVGLKTNGLKGVLGLWLGKNESSAFWMSFYLNAQVL